MRSVEIKDCPGYFIYEDGWVYSTKANKVLSMQISWHGYPYSSLKTDDGVSHTKYTHKALAEAFIPNPNPEVFNQINHKDGNKRNFRLENLEWTTNTENQLHAHRLGLKPNGGYGLHNARFDEDGIREVLKLGMEGLKGKEIAERYNVSINTIKRILNGSSYKYLRAKINGKQGEILPQ